MQIQGINRTDPEKVFIICRNDGTVAISAGQPVVWQMDGTRDGLDVVTSKEAGAASDGLLCGLAHESMSIGSANDSAGFGLVQCYGYDDDAVCMQHGTATNAAAVVGDLMYVNTALNALSCLRPGSTLFTVSSDANVSIPIHLGNLICCSANASTSNSTITTQSRVFLRLM